MQDSILKTTAQDSAIGGASIIAPKGSKLKKNLVAGVILTSLVDAFSILVIYLLLSFSSSGEILILSKDMELPTAMQTIELERKTLVKIEKEKYFIDDEEVPSSALVAKLLEIRQNLKKENPELEEYPITLQADRRIEYKWVNQVIQASSHAGFNEIKFAVITN